MIFIVVFDVPFELWNFNRQQMMTRQEVRDEMKDSEGRPEVKSRILALQRDGTAADDGGCAHGGCGDHEPDAFRGGAHNDAVSGKAPVLVAKAAT